MSLIDVNGDSVKVAHLSADDRRLVVDGLSALTGINLVVSGGMLVEGAPRERAGDDAEPSGSRTARRLLTTMMIMSQTLTISPGDKNQGRGFDVEYSSRQVETEFEGNAPPGLDEETMGQAMVLLHEMMHTIPGAAARSRWGLGLPNVSDECARFGGVHSGP